MRSAVITGSVLVLAIGFIASCSSDPPPGVIGITGGAGGTGGSGKGTPITSAGGRSASGGIGGASSISGAGGMGAAPAAGGKVGSGGSIAAGGAGGGTKAAGGTSGATGGGTSKGGTTGSGGKGSSSGGSGTTGPTTCDLSSLPKASGNGSLTWYYMGQGSYLPSEAKGKYQFACGYYGTGDKGGSSNDLVTNIPDPKYYAAYPGESDKVFSNSKLCGGCVKFTNGSKSVIATIVDECPLDGPVKNPKCTQGHIDLSQQAYNVLGYSEGSVSGTNWEFVPCPAKGNVILRMKYGNNNELFIENTVLPLKSVTLDGEAGVRQAYGAWHWDVMVMVGATLVLTDVAGRSITISPTSTEAMKDQDTGKQFPACL